jgi:choline monooxygenase
MGLSIREIIASYNPDLPARAASTPPSSWYSDPRIFDLEQKTVFSKTWQLVGRTAQLGVPGNYLTSDIGGEPILLVRGSDNIVRGFFNVCRHHAAVVMTQAEGKTGNLRCPYHGWTYNLEGALILTPEFGGVDNFDRGANGLIPVETAAWNDWVFAKLDSGNPSLEDFLGRDLLGRFERLNLGPMKWFERRHYNLNCNWKVFVDNYLDGGYHVPHLHGGLNSVLDYRNYTIETGERFCLQSSPIVSSAGEVKTAEVRKGEQALYCWIYPNLMINVYEGVMDTNLVMPRGIDKTEVVFDYYFADISDQVKKHNIASIAISERIQAEDVAVCESVQRGLNSRSYSTGRLSVRRESGEHLFHRLLYKDLQAGLAGG